MSEGKKMFLHTLKIDEYMTVGLNIPEVLDAIEFQAIVTKSKRLFNLTDENFGKWGRKRGSYVKKAKVLNPTSEKPKQSSEFLSKIWEDDHIQELLHLKRSTKMNSVEIAEKLNHKFNTTFTHKQVMDKASSLKKKGVL